MAILNAQDLNPTLVVVVFAIFESFAYEIDSLERNSL